MESYFKTGVVTGVILVLLLLETWMPFYSHFKGSWKQRVLHDGRNMALAMMNATLGAVLIGAGFFYQQQWAEAYHVGILRQVDWGPTSETIIVLILFDGWMYAWHRINHVIPFLWRFHRMHHSDPAMDATTGIRFHPGEILLSAAARLIVLPLLGMELWQLLLYETLLLPVILFHHANITLPRKLDHVLNFFVVTPAMHRVHHSRERAETNSNYGSILPYWDLLAGSWRTREDLTSIQFGVDGWQETHWQTLKGLLLTPLRKINIQKK
ncbi:Fatty acid hydroxylase [Planctomycetales bacterium 10988]|nr:Fatty acid hydroxylase [Planctomycetales bacterium 10988]